MSLLIVIAAASVWGIVASAIALHRDGYRRVPTDGTRLP
ncbi:hypothetical protein HDC37_002784 [Microbacterium sp. AK009]|nr:hypothetical protein [Microbacterium sp. AK009]